MQSHPSIFSVPSSLPSTCSSSPNSRIEGYDSTRLSRLLCINETALGSLPQVVLDVLFLLAISSGRISEIISLSTTDYIGSGSYLCRGKKRSRDYSVYVGKEPSFFNLKGVLSDPVLLFPVTYCMVYRWCVRAGIGFLPAGRVKVARTHMSRYLTADSALRVGGPDSVTSLLHHNSKRSASYYCGKRGSAHG